MTSNGYEAAASIGLGDAAHRQALSEAGLSVVTEYVDEGGNHYYDCQS